MKSWVLNNKLLIVGIVVGAIGGTCMISSKWHNSTAYGAIMGGLAFSMFKKEKNGTGK